MTIPFQPSIYDVVKHGCASQNKQELIDLLGEIVRVEPKVILEVGAWKGFSMELWYKTFEPEILISIENDKEALDFLQMRTNRGEFGYMNPPATLIALDSHSPEAYVKTKENLYGKHIDFLFIDGDHSYEGVKKDFAMYSSLVKVGGVIAFHDIMLTGYKWEAAGVEVCKLWNEVKLNYKHREIHYEGGSGIGLLYV